MSNHKLVVFFGSAAILASGALAFAQERDPGRTTPAAAGAVTHQSGAAMNPDSGRSSTGPLGNSTNRLENGTASGKGSGPGAGSPNGGG